MIIKIIILAFFLSLFGASCCHKFVLEEFKTFWKNEELEIIYKILKFIEHSDKIDEKNNYINIIEGIVKTKEKLVQDYINKYSTSYN